MLGSATSGCPGALNVNLTGGLSLKSESEPFIETSRKGKSADLSLEGANGFVFGNIFVKNLENHIIANVFDVKFKGLVPDGDLAGILLYDSLESLISVINDCEWVHLSKELGVSCQFSFHDREVKSALC